PQGTRLLGLHDLQIAESGEVLVFDRDHAVGEHGPVALHGEAGPCQPAVEGQFPHLADLYPVPAHVVAHPQAVGIGEQGGVADGRAVDGTSHQLEDANQRHGRHQDGRCHPEKECPGRHRPPPGAVSTAANGAARPGTASSSTATPTAGPAGVSRTVRPSRSSSSVSRAPARCGSPPAAGTRSPIVARIGSRSAKYCSAVVNVRVTSGSSWNWMPSNISRKRAMFSGSEKYSLR